MSQLPAVAEDIAQCGEKGVAHGKAAVAQGLSKHKHTITPQADMHVRTLMLSCVTGAYKQDSLCAGGPLNGRGCKHFCSFTGHERGKFGKTL